MSLAQFDGSWVYTEHGLLVPLGRFAQQIGVVDAFGDVSYGMKTVDHSPGDKVSELFAHICAGGMHVNELAKSAHPLVKDQTVARAWGQEGFASASGVSALLHVVKPEAVGELKVRLHDVLEPRRRRVLAQLSPSYLVVDLDLMGLVVSDQAKSYEGAAYGHMGVLQRVGRGYQFARAQLWTPDDVLMIDGFLHPGQTVSQHCLKELVGSVESELGRPRRRVECVEERLAEARTQLKLLEEQVAALEGKPKLQARRERLVAKREFQVKLVGVLEERVAELIADNTSNPNPRRIILRMDGGFGNVEPIIWLWEQGYSFVVRAHHQSVAEKLREQVEGLEWEKISHNGFIAESQQTQFGKCLYPMRLFLCRQERGDRPDYWSATVVSPDLDPKDWPVRRIGVFYNGRQTIEAMNKEEKVVFAGSRLPTGNRAGIALYEELVMLAQNLLRWFLRRVLANTPLRDKGMKELVHIAANARARVVRGQGAITITFVPEGPWPGLTVTIGPEFAYQLAFPFLDDLSLVRTA